MRIPRRAPTTADETRDPEADQPRSIIDVEAAIRRVLRSPQVLQPLAEMIGRIVRAELGRIAPDELVDARTAARLLGMSEAAVRKATERGQIPAVRIGRRVRYRRRDLLRNEKGGNL